jgi:hypothetical protein
VGGHQSIPDCRKRLKKNIPQMTGPVLNRKRKVIVKIYRRMYETEQSALEQARINVAASRVILNALYSRIFLKRLLHFGGATEPA